MKNIAVVVCLLLSVSAISQNSVGVELGVSSSNLRGNTTFDNNKRLVSIAPGIFYEYKFSESFALKAVFSYQKKGFVAKGSQVVYSSSDDPRFDSLEDTNIFWEFITINPLLKYRTKGSTKFFANVGPFLGVNTNGSSNDASDFGITTGVGVERDVQNLTFSVEARNSLGLSNLYKNSAISEYFETKTNAYYVLLGAAYNF